MLTNIIKKKVHNFYGVSKKCNEWLKHFDINSNGTFYVAIDLEEAKKNEKYIQKDNENIIITYIGRMIKEKGALELIEAYKILKQKYKNIELNLVGDGPILKKIIAATKDEENITTYGNLEHKDVMRILGKTNIFVNPSHFAEGAPTTLLEAGITKCAIITTPVGMATEIIKDNETGIICGYEKEDMANKIEIFINNKNAMKKVGENIYKLVMKDFNWDVISRKIYETII